MVPIFFLICSQMEVRRTLMATESILICPVVDWRWEAGAVSK